MPSLAIHRWPALLNLGQVRLITCLFASLFAGLVVGGLGAQEGGQPEPGLGPVPRVTPLLPLVNEQRSLSLEDQLLHNLRLAIKARDERILSLMDRASGDLPATGGMPTPAAEPDRIDRDRAWHELNQALRDHRAERQQSSDILDSPALFSDAFQVKSLTAHNQLARARSFKALLEDQEQPASGELRQAFEVVREISVEHLADHARPQRLYLLFWFASELAVISSNEERASYVETARNAHQRLVTDWPGSVSLVISANTLLEQLTLRLANEPTL